MELPINYNHISIPEKKIVRNEYAIRQEGKCWHCGNKLNSLPAHEVLTAVIDHYLFPEGFFDYPVHLHHNHDTGMTIGVVHARCNAFLWQFLGE